MMKELGGIIMRHTKKFFKALAVFLCLSICIDMVSFSKDNYLQTVRASTGESLETVSPDTMINYKEEAYSCPVKGLTNVETIGLRMNPSGNVQFNLYNYYSKDIENIAYVTYDSKGKKQVEKCAEGNLGSDPREVVLNGDRGYGILHDKEHYDRELVVAKKIRNGKIKDGTRISWKILKKIKIDVSKFRKKKDDRIFLDILEVKGENTVILRYSNGINGKGKNYSGVIQVNIATGKVKKLLGANFYMSQYDGKYMYCAEERAGKDIFYRISLETKKVDTLVADPVLGGEYDAGPYTIFDGKVLGIDKDGKVYYGTFDSKKFEQIGQISHCKNWEKYGICGLAVKNENEFYIAYAPKVFRGEEYDHSYGKVFVAKYYK